MKNMLCLFLAAALLLGCAALAEDAPRMEKDLVVLFTSDVHCGVDQGWGYAGLYAVKQSLSNDHYVLLVDDGDAIQGEPIGTMTAGEAIIDIMNAVGYDIAIPGNHEFDYGMDRFLELAQRASFPYLSCNFNKNGELVFAPYLIKTFDGMQIAFVGVTTPTTMRTSNPKHFINENGETVYGFLQDGDGESVYAAIQHAVDSARAEGADYVVVLAHLGNSAETAPWLYSDIISHTTGIDAVLDGHSHDTDQVVMKNKDGKDVVRSACGTKLSHIGALTLTADGRMSARLYAWGTDIAASELLGFANTASEAVSAASGVLNEKLRQVVAHTAVDLIIHDPVAKTEDGNAVRIIRSAETNLGDLCADAYLDQSGGADIAFAFGGSIRSAIRQGDITMNDILIVHPWGNSLTVIEATGQQVLDALEWSVHSLPSEFGGFAHVAGITFEVDVSLPTPCVQNESMMFDHVEDTMERRVRSVLAGGEPIDPNKLYKIVSLDYYLLDKGDGYTMFDGCTVVQESVKLDYQALSDYITGTLGSIVGEGYENPYGQGRVVSVNAE